MEAKAIAKGVKMAPRKCRLTIDLIRGKNVEEAFNILSNINNKGARLIVSVLTSAVANAENNLELDKTKLYVKEAYVNEAQTLKRINQGTKGSPRPVLKRSSHITIVVSEKN
jgi:large subunit ribosomal protein L22